MNKHKQNENGFGLVEILLSVLVVSVIGFGGYYIYHTNTQTKQRHHIISITKKVAASPAQNATTSSTTEATVANQTIFKIPRLGIEIINLPSNLSNLTMYYSTSNNTSSEDFSTTSLTALGTHCSAQGMALGELFVTQGIYNSSKDQGPFRFVKQFNGFWVGAEPNGIPCSSKQTVINIQGNLGTEFYNTVINPANIQLIQ